jgi:hypothetical protein
MHVNIELAIDTMKQQVAVKTINSSRATMCIPGTTREKIKANTPGNQLYNISLKLKQDL